MYTILVNNDKTLTTSVKSHLIKGTTIDEVVVLYKPTPHIAESDDPNIVITESNQYTAILKYKVDGVTKSEPLAVEDQLYKDRILFKVVKGSNFFNNKGIISIWVDITIDTTITTTTTVIDSETEDTSSESITENFVTLPTTLFIEEIHGHKCRRHDGNTIRITRGDSLTISISLTDNDGVPYSPVEGDEVWFTVKKSAIAEDILIQKSVDITELVLELVEEDTRNLAFGDYKYEVEVITASGDHYTVIKNAPFVITEELHE